MTNKILIICGPTSSGKTALALHLAGTRPTSIISADSRQIYRGLTILTGKDIPPGYHKEKNYYTDGVVRLYGYDLCGPDETFSAAEYSDYMRTIIDKEINENQQVMIVGGTGFYLKALTEPTSLAKVPPDEKLRQELNRFSVEELWRKLKEIDPERLNSMNRSDVNNPRRLIRAIEIASSRSSPELGKFAKLDQEIAFTWIGLRPSLSEIKERIASRVDSRLTAAVDEVKVLLVAYPDRTLPIYTSLGVRPILRYLAGPEKASSGRLTRQQLRDLWITDEVNYAKRQLTWFKKQKQIIWYDLNDVIPAKAGIYTDRFRVKPGMTRVGRQKLL